MVANAAASVQLMALYFTSLALFMPSALVQELSSFQAQESVVSAQPVGALCHGMPWGSPPLAHALMLNYRTQNAVPTTAYSWHSC